MHTSSLMRDTKTAQVYRYLLNRQGEWVDAWKLTLATQTTAISTRISEIRAQIPPDQRLEKRQEGKKFFYRIVREEPCLN